MNGKPPSRCRLSADKFHRIGCSRPSQNPPLTAIGTCIFEGPVAPLVRIDFARIGPLAWGPLFCRYRDGPAQTGDFPEEACFGRERLQPMSFRRGDDLVWRVEEYLKLLAHHAEC